MRVDAYNRVSKLYEAQSISKVKKGQKVSQKQDEVKISDAGRDILFVREAVKSTPDIRENKVNDIIARMESGTYDVGAKEVANKIVDKYFDKSI